MSNRPKTTYKFNQKRFLKVLHHSVSWHEGQNGRAKILDISPTTMSRIENHSREPTIQELLNLCNHVAELHPAYFFDLSEEEPDPTRASY